METVYLETPHNFNEIENSICTDIQKIAEKMLSEDTLFFYDACSFQMHANMPNPECLFEFIKRNNGSVIILRSILMELESDQGLLKMRYIKYIKKMKQTGVRVFVVYEEDFFFLLSQCFSGNERINSMLSWAVKVIKRPTGTIEDTLKSESDLMHQIIKGNVVDGTLYDRFFHCVRMNKQSGDNLGEELITICIYLLSYIPDNRKYKYIVLTDDKGAIGLINKAYKNVNTHIKENAFSALTTARLAQRLYEEGLVTDETQVEKILSLVSSDGKIKVLGSEKYDLDIKQKVMSIRELAQKIVSPNAIHINF